jgi:hypothetical protein
MIYSFHETCEVCEQPAEITVWYGRKLQLMRCRRHIHTPWVALPFAERLERFLALPFSAFTQRCSISP